MGRLRLILAEILSAVGNTRWKYILIADRLPDSQTHLSINNYKSSHLICFNPKVYFQALTSLNWSHNGTKNYTVDLLSRNRFQRPLTNCHTAETTGK